ncbi:MAG: XRE family transcriptional regulator [Planctomycetia bacterium]|nr:XRE family transcriptional regulator [Planctomycetia bacterium]
MKTRVEEALSTLEGVRLFEQERAIYDVTGLVENVMEKERVSRTDLANRLGKTRGWVTQLLDGEANKTVRTLADVFAVLGHSLRFSAEPLDGGAEKFIGRGQVTFELDLRPPLEATTGVWHVTRAGRQELVPKLVT